jgi:hypothetical protein
MISLTTRPTRPSWSPLLALLACAATVALSAGCSLSDSGQKPGELGNGGFYFSCDDAVSCSRYSNDAAKFPEAVSVGSTFAVRFVPKSNSGLDIHFNESVVDRGITVNPISETYVSRGAKGLAAVKTGYATLASRDASGALVDYVVVRVAKPDALVVYSADDVTDTPAHVDSISLSVGASDQRSYRAFAQQNSATLAGSLAVEWTSTNPSVASVASTTDGKATIVAKSAGSAMLVAVGGAFTQQIPVTVSP